MCSQMGCGREEGGGAQGFGGREEGTGGSACSQAGISTEEPDSRRPQCGSKEHETNHSGPFGTFAYVCVHDRGPWVCT